jgi:membrane-associated protein
LDLIHHALWFLKPEGINYLIQSFGLLGICLIIFSETAIFPLLPGDSLLVLCGIAAAGTGGQTLLSLRTLLVIVPICAVAGDQVGYMVGSLVGQSIYGWRERRLGPVPIFKQQWLHQTEDFYKRWGVFTIMACRWVPIVRTFAPVVAGVTKMPYKRFVPYNVLGGVSWVWSMLLTGYFLDAAIKGVWPGFELTKYIDIIMVIIVLLSVSPMIYTVLKEKGARTAHKTAPKKKRKKA